MRFSPCFYQLQPREADLGYGKTDSVEPFKEDTGKAAKHVGHVNPWVLLLI